MQRIVTEIPMDCELVISSCTHIGSQLCHYRGIDKMVKYVKAKPDTRRFIHLGDIIEAITTDDKRYHVEGMTTPIPLRQIQEAMEIFRPIREQIIVVLGGNHELKLHRFGNLVELFCSEKNGINVPYGTRTARVVFQNNGKRLFNGFFTHDVPIFKSNAKDYLQRQANMLAAMKMSIMYRMGDCALNICVSEDTEILTDNGWQTIGNIKVGDTATTFNMETHTVLNQPVRRVIENVNEEDLYCFKNSVVDIAVTGDHNMVYKSLPTSPQWHKIKAKDIKYSQITIPVSGLSENTDYAIKDDMLTLVGYLISEGHFRQNRKNGAINLFQREGNEKPIVRVLDNLGIKYSVYLRKMAGRKFTCPHSGKEYETKHDLVTFYIPFKEAREIYQYITNKQFPAWVNKLSNRQFEVLLIALMYGDGSWAADGHSGHYYTKDKLSADAFQIACVTHGWKASISERKGGYEIGIHKRLTNTLALKQLPEISSRMKSNRTWCITVDNGTIFTRRNGKVAIVGNCGHAHQLMVVPPSPILYLTDGEESVKQHYLQGDMGNGGFINPDQRWYGCAGSFRKKFKDGIDDYADIYNPVEIGYLICTIQNGVITSLEKKVV